MLEWTLILGGFLLGSIMFSRILPRLILKKDVCSLFADRNPGAANVFSSCGVVMGMICLLLDMAKGFLPVFLGCMFLEPNELLFAAVIAAPVLGHAVGLFNGLHGGKCIAVSFGVLLGLQPVSMVGWILAALYVFFSVIVKINPHRMRSILSFAIFAAVACVILIITRQYSVAVGCVALSVIAITKHTKLFSPEEENESENQDEEEENLQTF